MSEEIILRPYQHDSKEGLRDGIRNGHRCQVLVAPTGAGKTVIGSSLLKDIQAKGTRAAFIVDRIALVEQTSRMLWNYDIPHGMAQGQNTFGQQEKIQVFSAQTLEKRNALYGDWDVLIIDECHTMRQFLLEYIANCKAKVIGLTATPFSKGMGKIYSNLVNVTTTNKLIAEKFLAPLKVYAAVKPDMTGAKKVGGEWTDREVEKRGKEIIGDIIAEWRDKTNLHFGGPVKTIGFSATVDHGEEICRQFQAAGFNFQQVSYKDGNDERRAKLIEEFRQPNSDIVGLVSCEALAKGFDVPDIHVGIGARPYRKSFASHIQQIGRVMRPSPGKEFALWLDHAGNYLGFLPEMENLFEYGVLKLDDEDLENVTRREVDEDKSDFVCHNCGIIIPPTASMCPSCGHMVARRTVVEVVPGEMIALDSRPAKPRLKEYLDRDRRIVWQEICFMARSRKGNDVDAALRFAKAQYHALYDLWPGGSWGFDPGNTIDYRLESHIRSNLIRYAKSRKRA